MKKDGLFGLAIAAVALVMSALALTGAMSVPAVNTGALAGMFVGLAGLVAALVTRDVARAAVLAGGVKARVVTADGAEMVKKMGNGLGETKKIIPLFFMVTLASCFSDRVLGTVETATANDTDGVIEISRLHMFKNDQDAEKKYTDLIRISQGDKAFFCVEVSGYWGVEVNINGEKFPTRGMFPISVKDLSKSGNKEPGLRYKDWTWLAPETVEQIISCQSLGFQKKIPAKKLEEVKAFFSGQSLGNSTGAEAEIPEDELDDIKTFISKVNYYENFYAEMRAGQQSRTNAELVKMTETKKRLNGVLEWVKNSAGQWESSERSSRQRYNPGEAKIYSIEYKGKVYSMIGFPTFRLADRKISDTKSETVHVPCLDFYILRSGDFSINLEKFAECKNVLKIFCYVRVDDRSSTNIPESITAELNEALYGKSYSQDALAIPTLYMAEDNLVRFGINTTGTLSNDVYCECSHKNFAAFFPVSLQ